MPKSNVRKKKVKKKKVNKGIESYIWLDGKKRLMSDILIEFAEPMLEGATDIEDYRKAFYYCMVVWNLADLEGEIREEFRISMSKTMEASGIPLAESEYVLETMLERKEKYFKGVQRMIVDYDLTVVNKDLKLNVTSTAI